MKRIYSGRNHISLSKRYLRPPNFSLGHFITLGFACQEGFLVVISGYHIMGMDNRKVKHV